MATKAAKVQEWRRRDQDGEYLISTSVKLLNYDFINTAFASEDMYWAKPVTPDLITALLDQSLTLGLYQVSPAVPTPASADSPSSPRTPSPTLDDKPKEELEQIGMARFITDQVTTAYLTDVFIAPDHRRKDLGKWVIACCREVMEGLPAMRRAFLLANPDVGKKFYSRELGFWDMSDEKEHVICMTRRAYELGGQ